MAVSLKPVKEQTLVITGASSGIGLTTARVAAEQGARLVLAARSEEALKQLEQELSTAGTQVVVVTADVGNESDVRKIADAAISRFGGFDTWVNDAGISVYGRIEEVALEDQRRVFETNFWGMFHGSRIALETLKTRGGALINVGSTVSDRAIPLQGIYSASKFAVKGFTDALRMEVEEEGAPVSITLIKPAGINTPFTQHAKNYLDKEPSLPPPVYAPETVARAILHAAAHPAREIFVGSASKTFSVAEKYAPRLTDRIMEKTMFGLQKSKKPPTRDREGSLHRPGQVGYLHERGEYEGHTQERSFYTDATTHPWITSAVLGVAGVALAAALLAARPTETPAHRAIRNARDKARSWWS